MTEVPVYLIRTSKLPEDNPAQPAVLPQKSLANKDLAMKG